MADPSPVRRPLNPKQLQFLKGLAHDLNPVVQLGKNGWTDPLKQQLQEALDVHELVKVKIGRECPVEASEVSERLEQELGCTVVQTLGRVVTAYQAPPKNPKIQLPR